VLLVRRRLPRRDNAFGGHSSNDDLGPRLLASKAGCFLPSRIGEISTQFHECPLANPVPIFRKANLANPYEIGRADVGIIVLKGGGVDRAVKNSPDVR
jgi:hypothetical protein